MADSGQLCHFWLGDFKLRDASSVIRPLRNFTVATAAISAVVAMSPLQARAEVDEIRLARTSSISAFWDRVPPNGPYGPSPTHSEAREKGRY